MNKLYLLALLCSSALLRAEEPDDEYLEIYNLILQGDTLAERGRSEAARQKYSEAQTGLDRVQKTYPGWNEEVVQFRMNYVMQKLRLAGNAEKPAPAADGVVERIKLLLEQNRQLTAEKELLQARLKEALAAQPAAVDPRELANSEEKIKLLRKEIEVLAVHLRKAELKPDKPIDPVTFEQTRQGLAAANQKLKQQMEIAAALSLERDALQHRLQMLADGTDGKAPRDGNDLLQSRVKVDPVSESNTQEMRPNELASRRDIELVTRTRTLEKQLADARKAAQTNSDLVSALQTALRRAQEEKEGPANAPAANPTAQRDEIEQLTRQIGVLRSQLHAIEARAIPYSPEELVLFKTSNAIGAQAGFNDGKKVLVKSVPDARSPVIEAERAFAERRYVEAEKKYAQALRLDEKSDSLRTGLAAVQIEQNRWAEGETNLKRALAENPKNAAGLSLLGLVKMRQRKYDEALNLLSESAQLDPQNANTFQYLGVTLAEKGLRSPAESAFRRAIQLSPENGDAHHNLAIVYATQQPPALEQARWHYQKGLTGGHPKDSRLEQILSANKPAATGGANTLNR